MTADYLKVQQFSNFRFSIIFVLLKKLYDKNIISLPVSKFILARKIYLHLACPVIKQTGHPRFGSL